MEILCFLSETLAADSLINCQTHSINFISIHIAKRPLHTHRKVHDDKWQLTLPETTPGLAIAYMYDHKGISPLCVLYYLSYTVNNEGLVK